MINIYEQLISHILKTFIRVFNKDFWLIPRVIVIQVIKKDHF